MYKSAICLLSLLLITAACRTGRTVSTSLTGEQERIRQLEGDIDVYKAEHEKVTRRLSEVQQELAAEQARAASMSALVKVSSVRLSSVEASLQSREVEAVESGGRIMQLEAQRNALQAKASHLQDDLQNIEIESVALSKEIGGLRSELQQRELTFIPESFRTVNQILSRLPFGDIAFNTPKHMNVGDATEVSLKLSLTAGVEELKRRVVARALQKDETIRAEQVKVHSLMRASLTGSNGFSVTPLDNVEDKPVPSSGIQQWLWEVEAKKPGTQRLHLTLSALLEVEGKERPFPVETFSETIEVKVSKERAAKGFVAGNWQWLWATVVAPVAVALWEGLKRLKSKRRESQIIKP